MMDVFIQLGGLTGLRDYIVSLAFDGYYGGEYGVPRQPMIYGGEWVPDAPGAALLPTDLELPTIFLSFGLATADKWGTPPTLLKATPGTLYGNHRSSAFAALSTFEADEAAIAIGIHVQTGSSALRSETVRLGPVPSGTRVYIELNRNSPLRMLIEAQHLDSTKRQRCRVSCSDGLEKEGCIECNLGELIVRTCC